MERSAANWPRGSAPVAVIMITFNEEHNIEPVLNNLRGWAAEVFMVDSYSADGTVDTALKHGVPVVQREFSGFGDQWQFALNALPVTAPWTMKLDPDERLTDELKTSISEAIEDGGAEGLLVKRRLWFMGRPLPLTQELLRAWRTGSCQFTDVRVNEHPIVEGALRRVSGHLEHHDSPDLHSWVGKQNRYTTAEALARFHGEDLAAAPRLLGSKLERRMWVKRNLHKIPFRYQLLFFYHLIQVKPWISGGTGVMWARMRVWVYRMREAKLKEMRKKGRAISRLETARGAPHPLAAQAERSQQKPKGSPSR